MLPYLGRTEQAAARRDLADPKRGLAPLLQRPSSEPNVFQVRKHRPAPPRAAFADLYPQAGESCSTDSRLP